MKHLFIINPRAGMGAAIPDLLGQIRDHFSTEECEVIQTTYAGHAEDLSRQAAQQGDPVRIYACGGDGTLNEVVNGAAGYDNAAITHVPIGTGNDFLKIFGDALPQFRQVEKLKNGPQTAFDVMDCNGRLGLDIVCAGVDARIGSEVHHYSSLPFLKGKGAYVASLVVNVLFKGISRPMRVTINDEIWDQDTSILCICNGRHYGGGFMPIGDAMPDDGVLDVLLAPKVSLFTLARIIGDYSNGRYFKHPKLLHRHAAKELRFSSQRPIVAVVDGETMVNTSFLLRLSEKKVNFFYPEGACYPSQAPEST